MMMLTEGQTSDHKSARLTLDALPAATALIGARGYDSNWFRKALTERGTRPCIPPTNGRKTPSTTTRRSTVNATKSKIFSLSSRIAASGAFYPNQ